ncbi:MAG: TonB-dependent receptor [Bacteroidales bacterium]|nr:TonB-dependent receptor [Bacteroidales bacterium]
MKHQNFIRQQAFRFRRFSRYGYAAFRSMHRVVNIGRLAIHVADHQLKKSAVVLALAVPVVAGSAFAQDDDVLDEHLLPTIDITAPLLPEQGSPDAIQVIPQSQLQGLAVSSIGELLEQLPGVDLRARGGNDVQSDLTLRGSTFDQVLVLLNGVNLADPQTGHHNLDIPIDLSLVDRVEVLPPSALLRYGLTSLCGAVNIVTKAPSANHPSLSLSAGSFGQMHVVGALPFAVGSWHLFSAASHHRSQGYQPNTDYRFSNLWLQAQRADSLGQWLLQLGTQVKDFGSQAFYSSTYPHQFESTRTLMAAATRQQKINTWDLEATLCARLHTDRFELFRSQYVEPPSWYGGHNYHFSNSLGLRVRLSRLWVAGRSTLGAEVRHEGILSNVLGDSIGSPLPVIFDDGDHYYTLGKSRLTSNLFAHHSVFLGPVSITAALLGSHNTLRGFNHGYSLSVRSPLGRWLRLDCSVGRSMRMPTFTDLYYHSVNQVSNPALLPEVGYTAEANLHYHRRHFLAEGTVYARHGVHIIDWIRLPESDVWHSMNHTQVDAWGSLLRASYKADGLLRRINVSYSYCSVAQTADGYVSSYALDYLRHKCDASVVLSPVDNLRVKMLADFQWREGQYSDAAGLLHHYNPVALLNAEVEYQLRSITFFVEGDNLLNRTYCDYGGVTQPGISCLAGIRYSR